MLREIAQTFSLEFSEDARWVALIALAAAMAFALFSTYVFLRLIDVRPFLVFLPVDGHLPPVCGLCVLFGTLAV